MATLAAAPRASSARPRVPSRSSRRVSSRVLATPRAEAGAIRREVLDRQSRTKQNVADDRAFYSVPRMCTHVDDAFLAQLTQLYRERVPANGRVFDICSSWISHLPSEVEYEEVVGHGMNAEELAANPRLSKFFVKNLNETPAFAAADKSFDAVLCCVSVQYLQRPEEVFAEVWRVLKPGGVFIVSFSNRLFYEKAVAAWRDGSGYSRSQLVKEYFGAVEGFTQPEVITEVGVEPDRSLMGKLRAFAKRSSGDPFYAVVAHRNFKPVE
jgi:SAM-dependent methyltransferase